MDRPSGAPDRRPDAPDTPWYEQHLRRRFNPYAADRFKPEIARHVPDRGDHPKVMGAIDLGEHGAFRLVSGKDGPAGKVDMPGKTKAIEHHVEAHAAAALRHTGADRATLYINEDPCRRRQGNSCQRALPDMLPEGARLTIYAPAGQTYVFFGRPDRIEEQR